MKFKESVFLWLSEAQHLAEAYQDDGDALYLQKRGYDIVRQMGFIKHAIVLSYYCLLVHAKTGGAFTYNNAIREVISLAGDSDTNACIVGGMMGALLGFKALDEHMVRSVLSCDVTGEGQPRPIWLSVGKTAVPNI